MPIIIRSGNLIESGSSQNFSVYKQDSEKTEAGSTNEIQIYPVTTMGSWYMQNDEPSSKTTNDIWLSTSGIGKLYEFQPVSGVNLYTSVYSAQQWNGSSWDDKNTKCYYNGAWNPSDQYVLYDSGTFYTSFSVSVKGDLCSYHSYSDHFLMNANYTQDSSGKIILSSNSKIDLTDYSTLSIIYSSSQSSGYSLGQYIGISETRTNVDTYTRLDSKASLVTSSLDISDINIEKYIAISLSTTYYSQLSETGHDLSVYKIWLS